MALPIASLDAGRRPLAQLSLTPRTGTDGGYPWQDGELLYADDLNAAFLPIDGGTVQGPTMFTSTPLSSPSASMPVILQTAWDVTNTGGNSTEYQSATSHNINILSAAGQNVYANHDGITYTSPLPSTSGCAYVTSNSLIYAGTDRGTAPGAPKLWGMIVDAVDATGHASSLSGQILGMEVDLGAGGLDDADVRQGLVVIGQTRNYPTVPTSEFVRAFGIFGQDSGVTFKDLITLAAPYNNAGINLKGSFGVGGAPGIWLGDNMNIAWNTAGTATTHWNGNYVEHSGGVQIDGLLQVGTTLSVTGAATFQAGVQVDGAFYTPNNLTVGGLASLTDALLGRCSITGQVGFNNNAPVPRPTITGSRGGNAALTALMTALAVYGLVQDSTSA